MDKDLKETLNPYAVTVSFRHTANYTVGVAAANPEEAAVMSKTPFDKPDVTDFKVLKVQTKEEFETDLHKMQDIEEERQGQPIQ
jgi:hypothetical protein